MVGGTQLSLEYCMCDLEVAQRLLVAVQHKEAAAQVI